MPPRRRLFVRLLRSAFGFSAPPILMVCVLDFVDEGFSRTTARHAAGYPLAWLALSLLWAGWRTGSLARGARGLGIEVTEHALDDVQTHTLTGVSLSGIRTELGSARRAFDLTDGNPIDFRWRPFRRTRLSVQGSVAVDGTSGEARMEVRTAGKFTSDAFQGAAFTALCQIVRALESR